MIEQILLNLRIISKIKSQDKLSVWNSLLYINHPTWLRAIKRVVCRQNREETLAFIMQVVEDAVEFSNALITHKKVGCVETMNNEENFERRTRTIAFLQEYNSNIAWSNECNLRGLFEEFSKCILGLDNLKLTYSADPTASSKIENIQNTIKNQIKAIQKVMQD